MSTARTIAEGLAELGNELAPFLMPSRFGSFLPDRWNRIRELVTEVSAALDSFDGWASPQVRLEELRHILREFQELLAEHRAPTDVPLAQTLAEKSEHYGL